MKPSLTPKSVICWREGLTRERVLADVAAGATTSVVALPLAIAFAIASGVSPDRGLAAAIVGGLLVSLLGGSRVQIGGPSGAFILLVYEVVQKHGFEGLALTTLLAGVLLIALGLARLGTMIKYIPYPVTTGFTTGIAVIIASSQVKEFFGFQIDSLPVDFIGQWIEYMRHFASVDIDWTTLSIGLGSLALLLVVRERLRVVPGPIVPIVLFSFLTWAFDLPIATIGSKFGELPHTLPVPHWPGFSLNILREVGPSAVTIALLVGIESLLSAVVSDGMTGFRHKSNTELVAQGFANIGSVLFGGLPVTGALARTATNVKAGARTPLAGIANAVTLVLFMLVFAPLAKHIPLATLAAVLLTVAWSMSDLKKFRRMFRAPQGDRLLMVGVFLLTLFLDLTVAVQVGVVGASLLFMRRMSEIDDAVMLAQFRDDISSDGQNFEEEILSKKDIPPGVEIYEINGPLFFGVADRMKDALATMRKPPRVLILRMRHVPTMDATGIHALEELVLKSRKLGTSIVLSGIRPELRGLLKESGLEDLLGVEHIHDQIRGALVFARELTTKDR